MKKFILFIIFITFIKIITANTFAQSPTVVTDPRYAACDFCGYCPPNPLPQSWSACQKCLYPDISSDPSTMESLVIDPETNTAIAPAPGKQYTFLGCLGSGNGAFSDQGSAGGVIQSLLNIIFAMAGGIAFLYLLYGSFVIATSQEEPEKLNYGKRVVYGAIAGVIFTLSSVFIVKFIASGILKIPGFGE